MPHIDKFQGNGYTKEEMKMVWETRKIFEDEQVLVNPTCVRIPVFFGHSEAVSIRTTQPIDAESVRQLLKAAPGVTLFENEDEYPTAVQHASGQDPVYVGRVRPHLDDDHGINMWVVSDNVRKGAALNSVQIAEQLLSELAA